MKLLPVPSQDSAQKAFYRISRRHLNKPYYYDKMPDYFTERIATEGRVMRGVSAAFTVIAGLATYAVTQNPQVVTAAMAIASAGIAYRTGQEAWLNYHVFPVIRETWQQLGPSQFRYFIDNFRNRTTSETQNTP